MHQRRGRSSKVAEFKSDWKALKDKAGPFPPQAFQFVREGLAHTVKMIHGETTLSHADDESRHVSGQQLCLGLRDYAIKQYGRLAKTVLASWSIRETGDFGRIVFAMIDLGMMRKTEEDTPDDFRAVFDFDEAFGDLSISK
jgi:uncharacterized repeat protein (TIGR04138 family)